MDYDRKKHIKLLTNALELKKFNKDFEDWRELLNYEVLVVDQIFWTKRKQFLPVIFDFITGKVDYDNFETAFLLLFNPTQKEASTLKRDISYIEKFQPISEAKGFSSNIYVIYRLLEDVEDEYCTEGDVRDYLMKLFVTLQNFRFEEK